MAAGWALASPTSLLAAVPHSPGLLRWDLSSSSSAEAGVTLLIGTAKCVPLDRGADVRLGNAATNQTTWWLCCGKMKMCSHF